MGYYDDIAEGYDRLHAEEQLKKLRKIREYLEVDRDDRLLDVGCGTGISTSFWDCDVTGVDPSEGLLRQARLKHEGIRFVLAPAERLPFEDCVFDVVISVTAIHNFDDFRKGLDEMKRVGKDRFVFSVLKKSVRSGQIKECINAGFKVIDVIDEEKDEIFICIK